MLVIAGLFGARASGVAMRGDARQGLDSLPPGLAWLKITAVFLARHPRSSCSLPLLNRGAPRGDRGCAVVIAPGPQGARPPTDVPAQANKGEWPHSSRRRKRGGPKEPASSVPRIRTIAFTLPSFTAEYRQSRV